jgi:Raf kinase inhibitor-like YbhB/YbcL family protein
MSNKHLNWALVLITIGFFAVFSSVIIIKAENNITLTFHTGNPIPARFDAHPKGQNYSPPVSWINIPAGTKSLALIGIDPDGGNWIHWVLYNIPSTTNHLNENLPKNPVLSDHLKQGKTRDLLRLALESNQKSYALGHPSIAISQSNLALVLQDLGELEEARDLAKQAYDTFLDKFGSEHPKTKKAKNNWEAMQGMM